jgi:tRNA threonylcarbamoyladenosine biosynthesis protein TsaB
MNFLVMDTSTDRGVIGLLLQSGQMFTSSTQTARCRGRDLIPQLADNLRQAGKSLRDVDVLAVGLGPGSYTGLRVGVTAAKVLAYATGIPLIGLDSLEAMAKKAPSDARRISVIADAQRGQLYVAEYARVLDDRLVCAPECRIEPLQAWLARLEPGTFVLGPGLHSPRIRNALPAGFEIPDPAINYPVGQRLIELARESWFSGRRDDPWLLEPRYLRQSSAQEQWDSRNSPQPR